MANLGWVWLFGRRSKSHGRRLSLWPTGCMPALPMTRQHCCSCSCRLRHFISVMPLPLSFLIHCLLVVLRLLTEQLANKPTGSLVAHWSTHRLNDSRTSHLAKISYVKTGENDRSKCDFFKFSVGELTKKYYDIGTARCTTAE